MFHSLRTLISVIQYNKIIYDNVLMLPESIIGYHAGYLGIGSWRLCGTKGMTDSGNFK